MIKALLFVLGFIVLFAIIGLGIYFGVMLYRAKDEADRKVDKREEKIIDNYKTQLRNYSYEHGQAEINKEAKRLQALMEAELAALKKEESPIKKLTRNLMISVGCAIAALGFVITIPGSFHQVEAGTYAVVKEVGKIVDVKTPGTYFDFYMTKHYETYDATVQQVKINTAAYSKDGQTMDLEVYLQYQIQLDKLIIRDDNGNIIQTEGIAGKYVTLDSLQARIETQCIEKTKSVMSSAEAMTIIQDRALYSEQVSTVVREAIGPDYYVNVQDVVLTNIDFTDEFEKSVEDKVVAEQQKTAAETKASAEAEVAKIKAEADKAVAEIEAEKKIIEAEAEAKAQIIKAEAAARAAAAKIVELARTYGYTIAETTIEDVTVYTIDTSSGPGKEFFETMVKGYLEYLAYLEQWDGKLPEVVSGDNALSIIVPNAGENN